MQELTDSTALLEDAEALRRRFAVDGYLFFRGLLPSPRVAAVRADLFDVLQRCGWLDEDATIENPGPSPAGVPAAGDEYFSTYTEIQRLQSFHELAHEPGVLELIGRLLADEPALVHPRKIVRTSLPHDDGYTPPHQDYRHIQGSADTLTLWVPLGDCPISLGGLRVLPGSHLRGLAPAVPAHGTGGLTIEMDYDEGDWRASGFCAGDAILFSSLIVHAALPNNEDAFRLSADYRYQSLLDPVTEASLQPHGYPVVPGWDELTQGWSSVESVTAPADVVLAPVVSAFDPDLVPPPFRLLADV